MVNKKYILVAGVCAAMAFQPAFAQESNQGASWSSRDMTYRGMNYDVLDTAYISKRHMEQQKKFLNHQYAFPARPRNMWEVGLSLGTYNVFGDVTSKSPFTAVKPWNAVGVSAWVRKALGYSFSWRVQYVYGRASGFDYRSRLARGIWRDQSVIPGNYYVNHNDKQIFSNYDFRSHELTFQIVGNTNNILFNRAKNSLSFYGYLGAGFMAWKTSITYQDKNGNYFDFEKAPTVNKNQFKERKDFNKWYKDKLNGGKKVARTDLGSWEKIGDKGWMISPTFVAGLGMQIKLGGRVSLQIEEKLTYNATDGFDGVTMDPTVQAGLSPDNDVISYSSIGVGINLGNKAHRVQPLWWMNPLDYAYQEVSTPRHMQLPTPILPDADGDGVTDQFDKCPDTPSGVAVDAHGCPLDTDGDGVPDYRDKELITPTRCQPVDADGVGDCPCPEGCGNGNVCNIVAGTICFSSGSKSLSSNDKTQLESLAAQMKASPDCKVIVEGNQGANKRQSQHSWDRVNAVITYMNEVEHISRDRFIFRYKGHTGSLNCVMYRPAAKGETGAANPGPPHAQFELKH